VLIIKDVNLLNLKIERPGDAYLVTKDFSLIHK